MSDLNTKATVHLQVNGQQAGQTLQQLKNNALQLEAAIAKAAAAGNKTDLRRLRRELTDTKRQIREIESSTMQVESVLSRLDRATPKELNKSLATLNKQLDYMERGSEAWKAHIEKIKRVKAEIASINKEIRSQEGFWSRFNRTLNDWQTSLMGAIAAVTGFVMAGRSAVKAYADIEEELTNTQKYTGMTREAVEELNGSFKKLDTRTTRAQLNELAQEAGRLGKTSKEDVQGYVEAADIINVALVDLGAGATQTIAKLSNIFGVEKILGTKDAMLAVGSTVNVLSQNCTASKPYLVEFAQRMAGIGAQAKMSIPEILAFGAVLDANGQKTEMASSALGKLAMMLFQDPAKMAKMVGIEVNKFTETMKRSTSEGLVMFLERIQQMGSKDGLAILAPLFKDLGMDGVRMSQVLSTLAAHLDEVKWQFGEANKAFREATSASNEYELFNNTVQAGLDKAKKRISELAIELGEKLLPIMKHVYSSTSVMLRVLSLMVDFFIKNKAEIITATVLIGAYTAGVNAHTIATKAATIATAAWSSITTFATSITKAYSTAMVLSKDAIVGCSLANQRLYRHMLAQNVITKLITASTLLMKAAYFACTFQISAMKSSLKSLYMVMAANPYGIVLTAIAALGMAIYNNIQKRKEQQRLIEEEMQKQRELMKDYDTTKGKIATLNKILNDNTRDLKERKAALDDLKKIVPDYHADLSDEGTLINNNTEALDNYLAKLKESILMRANREKLEQLYLKQSELEEKEKTQSEEYWNTKQTNTLQGYNRNSLTARLSRLIGIEDETNLKKKLDNTKAELFEITSQIEQLEKTVTPESSNTTNTKNETSTSTSTFTPHTDDNKKTDKFEKENIWRKEQEAFNRIAYAKGEKNYLDYTNRMLDIEVEYNKKKLEHTDLTETEKLQIQAEYYEALKKISDAENKKSIDDENAAFSEKMAQLKQRYIDGLSTLEVYEEASERQEIEHLKTLTSLYEDGSTEQLNIQKQLQDKLFRNQKKHQKELEEAEKKHQADLAKVKEQVFGDNPQERQAKYAADLALLTEVYNAEIIAAEGNAKEKLRIEKAFQKSKIALMEYYNIEGAERNRGFLEEWNNDIMDFLESDMGKGITGSVDTLVSGMSSIFQQLTTIVQAELEIQKAAIDKRYDAEVSLAEGNNYKINKLEKQREAEQAKAKREANKKMFAMQVIQAVAQTAQAAISAYSSAAAIPVTGFVLAPIAASMAVAAGALQIAAIKKQQQASEAQGYQSGGFTPEGAVDEVAGVVHAGEWVASQKLVKDPRTRPILEALDNAQRTNTIGSLSAVDVSSTITAPAVMARSVAQNNVPQRIVVENNVDSSSSTTMKEVAEVISSLKQRLDEPFITVNSVTGEAGMKQAQDEYEKLIKNKTPKSRR